MQATAHKLIYVHAAPDVDDYEIGMRALYQGKYKICDYKDIKILGQVAAEEIYKFDLGVFAQAELPVE